MTRDERALLLTTARLLRATIRDMLPTANGLQDIEDLSDALAPFDPMQVPAVNECERPRAGKPKDFA